MARIYGHDEISDGLAPADKKLLPVFELPAEGGFFKKTSYRDLSFSFVTRQP